jgi:hypothetical protein
MSRATPEERRGRLIGSARGERGSCQAAPLPTGTMVPTVPMVPRVSKTPFCGLVRFGRRVSGFCGRRWLPRRDHPSRWSRHRLRRAVASGEDDSRLSWRGRRSSRSFPTTSAKPFNRLIWSVYRHWLWPPEGHQRDIRQCCSTPRLVRFYLVVILLLVRPRADGHPCRPNADASADQRARNRRNIEYRAESRISLILSDNSMDLTVVGFVASDAWLCAVLSVGGVDQNDDCDRVHQQASTTSRGVNLLPPR